MKKFKIKTIFAVALATMMTLSCGTAYADSNVDTSVAISETAELTNIGGYACYQRDGNFFTLLDGEEYLVIDMRSMTSSTNTYASIKPPQNWGNNTFVTLRDYQSYSGKVDLSKGDFYSPIFEVDEALADCRIEFSTDHIVNHKYYMTFWSHYKNPIDNWDPYYSEETFNVFLHTKVLLTGTSSAVIDAFGIEISSNSPGRDDFSYTVTPIKVNV